MKIRVLMIGFFVVFLSYNIYSEEIAEKTNNKVGLSLTTIKGISDGWDTFGKRIKLPSKTFLLQNKDLTLKFTYKSSSSQIHANWTPFLLPIASEKKSFVVLMIGALPRIDVFDVKIKNISKIRNSQTLNELVHTLKSIMTKEIFKVGGSVTPSSLELFEMGKNVCVFFINYNKKRVFIRGDLRTGKLFKESRLSDFFSIYCPSNIKRVLAPVKIVSSSDLYHSWKDCSDKRVNISGNIIDKAKIAGLFYKYRQQGFSRKAGFSIIKKSLIDAVILKKAAERFGILATPLLVKKEIEKRSSKLPVSERQKLNRISKKLGYKDFKDYIRRISNNKYVQEMFAISKYLEPQISNITINDDELNAYYKKNAEAIKKTFHFSGKIRRLAHNSMIINFMSKSTKSKENQKNVNSLKNLKMKLIMGKDNSIQQILSQFKFEIEIGRKPKMHPRDMSKWQNIPGLKNVLIGNLYNEDGKEKLSLLIVGSWREVYYKYAAKILLKKKIQKKIHKIIEIEKKNLSISITESPKKKSESSKNNAEWRKKHMSREEWMRVKGVSTSSEKLLTESELEKLFKPIDSKSIKNKYELAQAYDQQGDFVAAFKILKKLPEHGNLPANILLANYLQKGRKGIKNNPVKARELYQKIIAAVQSKSAMPTAQEYYLLGLSLKEINPKPKASAESIKAFEIAVNANYAPALCRLGECYWEGYSVRQNMKKGKELLTKSADMGYPRGMAFVSSLYLSSGNTKGLSLVKKSVIAGDKIGQYCLGVAYLMGAGLKRNKSKAEFWLQKSADQGYIKAINLLKKKFK